MKQKLFHFRSLFFICLFSMLGFAVWAQENTEGGGETTTTTTSTTKKTTDINITTDGDTWYSQPWVWIVGAAVFILILVALLSGNKGRDTVTTDRVTVKKTIDRDKTGS